MLAIRAPLFSNFAFHPPFRALFDGALTNEPSTWQVFSPAADVRELEDAYLLELDVPGMSEKDIEVVVEQSQLTLRGDRKPMEAKSYSRQERSFGRFERAFQFADDVDATRIEASAKNGVLTVKLPKAEKAKARSIAVKSE